MTNPTNIVKAATGLTLTGLLALTTATAANAAAEQYGQTKAWNVIAFSQPSGKFSHCAALRKQPGPNKILVAKIGELWGVQFLNSKWQFGPKRQTTARLAINGKGVAAKSAQISGNNVVFMLGQGRDAVASVETSRWLTFITESGKKIGYTLKGTGQAFDMVERCVADNSGPTQPAPNASAEPAQEQSETAQAAPEQSAPEQTPSQQPEAAQASPTPATQTGAVVEKNTIPSLPSQPQAPGQPVAIEDGKNVIPQGDEATAAPQTSAQQTSTNEVTVQPTRLDRKATLEIVADYLGDKASYTIAATGKGTFSNFVVNWKLQSGVLGAMSVYANQPRSVEAMLQETVAAEKKSCATQLKVTTKKLAPISEGLQARATAAMSCKKTGGTAVFSYQIVEIAPQTVAIIIEGLFVADKKAAAVTAPKSENA